MAARQAEQGQVVLRRARAAEPGGAEPAHGGVALLDAPMVLLDPVVQVPAGAMLHVGAGRLAYCTGVGVVAIGGHLWMPRSGVSRPMCR